jgi:O-antigen/teichoic acid export membrane protein
MTESQRDRTRNVVGNGIGGVSAVSRASLGVVAITALGGFAFWLVISRVVSDETMGEATAIVSSAIFVAFITNLGLPLAVGRYASLPTSADAARFGLAALVSAGAGLIGSVLYAVAAPETVNQLLAEPPVLGLVVFVAITASAPLVQLLDVRLLALGRFGLVLLRPAVSMVLKIAGALVVTLVVEPSNVPLAVFFALLAPDALFGLAGAAILGGKAIWATCRSRMMPVWRPAARAAGFNFVSLLLVQGTMMGVPIVVLAFVDSSANANFYVAWSFALVALVMTQAVMWGLHIEGESDVDQLRRQTSRAMLTSALLGVVLTFGSLLLVPLLPTLYGDDFVSAGRLAPFAVAICIPYSTTVMVLTEARVKESVSDILRISGTFALVVIIPLLVASPRFGSSGAVGAVLIGATCAALINGMARHRRLGRFSRRPAQVVHG